MANNSQTGSSSYDPLGRSSSEIGLEVALSILICLISILDNLLVVYVVDNDSRLKSVTSIFIHNLALTDISMASLQMPFWIISLYKGNLDFWRELVWDFSCDSVYVWTCFYPDHGAYRR